MANFEHPHGPLSSEDVRKDIHYSQMENLFSNPSFERPTKKDFEIYNDFLFSLKVIEK